jgi:hypothetical protein
MCEKSYVLFAVKPLAQGIVDTGYSRNVCWMSTERRIFLVIKQTGVDEIGHVFVSFGVRNFSNFP